MLHVLNRLIAQCDVDVKGGAEENEDAIGRSYKTS